MTATILILNGPIGAGKPVTLRDLQERLDAPFPEVRINKFLYLLPPANPHEAERWHTVIGYTRSPDGLIQP